MTVREYMLLASDLELAPNECVSVVHIKSDNNPRTPRIITCTSDSLPSGINSIKLKSLASSIIQILESRTGLQGDNIAAFLKAFNEVYIQRKEEDCERVMEECRKVLNVKIQ